MVSYWFCITSKENWEIIKREKIWAVSQRNQKLLEKTEVGDFLIFYVKPKKLAGIFKIISKPFKSEEKIFSSSGLVENEVFPYRVKLESIIIPENPINFEELIPKLRFIAKKETWPTYLRKAMIRTSKDSYNTIKQALKKNK